MHVATVVQVFVLFFFLLSFFYKDKRDRIGGTIYFYLKRSKNSTNEFTTEKDRAVGERGGQQNHLVDGLPTLFRTDTQVALLWWFRCCLLGAIGFRCCRYSPLASIGFGPGP